MKIGNVLSSSFRAMKSPTLWAVYVVGALATAVPFAVMALVFWQLAPTLPFTDVLASGLEGEAELVRMLITMYGAMIFGGLLALPMIVLTYGATIHAGDRALAHVPFTFGEAWSIAARRFFRILGLEIVLGLAYSVAAMVVAFAMAMLIAGGSAAFGEDNGAAIAGTFCLVFLFAAVTIMTIAFVWQSVERFATRYAVIGDQTAGQAMSSGFQAFRARWKQALGFFFVIMLITFAYQMVISMVTTPLMMLSYPWQAIMSGDPSAVPDAAIFDSQMRMMTWYYPLVMVLGLPLQLLVSVAWTAFFRDITGLDVPVAPPVYPTYPPYPQGAAPYGKAEPPLAPPVAENPVGGDL